MDKGIHILILEHDPLDIELLQFELKKSKLQYTTQVVQTKEAFEQALRTNPPDIILSDFSLPSFDGLFAFKLKQSLLSATPFIIVSGTIGEERAVELIKMGVTDYALKEKLYQIVPKIQRALQESADRKRKQEAEQQLSQREAQLRKIMDLSVDVICTIDSKDCFITVGAASNAAWGYAPEELIGRNTKELVHPDDRAKTAAAIDALKEGINLINFENRFIRKNGEAVSLLWSAHWDNHDQLSYCVARDATEIKKAQQKIEFNEKRFRTLLQNSNDGLSLLTPDGSIIERSPSAVKILGLANDECTGRFRVDLVHPEDRPLLDEACALVNKMPEETLTIEYRLLGPDGRYKWLETNIHNQLGEPAVGAIVLNFRDITEKKTAKIALEESEAKYRNLFNLSPIPLWVFDQETLAFIDVNEAAILHYGYSREEFQTMTLRNIWPEEEASELEKTHNAFKGYKLPYQSITRHLTKSGTVIDVEIKSILFNLNKQELRLVLVTDITERNRYLFAVEEQNKQLREIAWIQSHIVRAPLARIMGLINVLEYTPEIVNTPEMLRLIAASAMELDMIIRDIVRKTEQVNDQPSKKKEAIS